MPRLPLMLGSPDRASPVSAALIRQGAAMPPPGGFTMTTLTYDKTSYASVRDFIEQALDPTATFRWEIQRKAITRENAATEAAAYIQYVTGLDAANTDPDDWR